MNLLQKVNRIYGKHLFILVPFMTVLLGGLQLIFNISNQIIIVAVFILSVTSAMFTFLYVKEKKQNIIYFLIQINNFYYMSFMFIASRVNINDKAGVLFISFGVLFLFFILQLNSKYKKIINTLNSNNKKVE